MDWVVRFWSKVHGTDAGCWEWTAATSGGYGVFSRVRDGMPHLYAHRVSWELAYGPIPSGLFVLHSCDNRSCVNPDHLSLGTQSENLSDMRAKGRGRVPVARSGPDHHWYGRNVTGEANPHARITADDVREIRRLAGVGIHRDTLATRFGVSVAHIYAILKRRAWASVE